ncbi:putative RNA-binding protein 28 [Hypsibius exemplaris]|uniref:RNA-binding protein 28 n=1 Tax=Hypsibius exemplaris TaxID=2072580 RepID=A0A1W0WW00_HYPEX|nr:putative RNA-binding protein 28 [Hypsibius exemplaris]
MSFSGGNFRRPSFRRGADRGGRSDRGFRGGFDRGSSNRGFSSGSFRANPRGAFRGHGGIRGGGTGGYGQRPNWDDGFQAYGKRSSPTRDDRYGGHTLDSDQSHVSHIATRFNPRANPDDEVDNTSRPIIGGDQPRTSMPERKPSKMGRIIIRNLPFSTKEDDLKNLMAKCGKIMEVRIPLKDDGKMRGFAFVQFQSINSAETAIKMFNASKLKDRPIAVDWAVAKSRYDDALAARDAETARVKAEEPDVKEIEEDEEGEEKGDTNDDEKSEDGEEEESEKPVKEESDADDSSNADDSETEEGDDGTVRKKKPRTPKKPSDVEEGRTLFIRNLPYEETEESLLPFFKKFGVVKYFKLCIHADSGHSKGSGFVQYREKDSADRCLYAASSNDGLVLDSRKLLVCVAEKPKERRKAEKLKHEKPKKDNRNLALLQEGRLVKDADPVSQNDMRKRSMLDKRKAESLKNLHMFVSTTRLTVHNIPKSLDDAGLRDIFLKAVGVKKYAIKESRVIRDLQTLDHTGVGKSRGFGFVEFKNHADAVKAIAAVNNNPDIFKADKRPIVEFAVENKVALQKKQRRLENSQAKLFALKGNRQQQQPDGRQRASGPSALRPNASSLRPPRPVQEAQPKSTANSRIKQSQQPQASKSRQEASVPVAATAARGKAVEREPKKKAPKRKRVDLPDEQDDFGKAVEKYKKRLMRTEDETAAKSSRWFDD